MNCAAYFNSESLYSSRVNYLGLTPRYVVPGWIFFLYWKKHLIALLRSYSRCNSRKLKAYVVIFALSFVKCFKTYSGLQELVPTLFFLKCNSLNILNHRKRRNMSTEHISSYSEWKQFHFEVINNREQGNSKLLPNYSLHLQFLKYNNK